MMIKISDDFYVAADQITVVKALPKDNIVTFKTRDGGSYYFYPENGEKLGDSIQKFVSKVNLLCEARVGFSGARMTEHRLSL
jgi:hypothetical protein